jgi:hypothetical protein
MAEPTKTEGQTLLALQEIATAAVVVGSPVDVTAAFAGMAYVRFGRCAATALTASCRFRLEGSAKASGDGFWVPLFEWMSQVAAASDEAVSGTEAAGQDVISVASTTGLVAGDFVYFRNGTVANSEWARLKSIVTNTSVTLEEPIINAQTGATMYDQAEVFVIPLDLLGVGRLRLVVDTAAGPTGQTIAAEAWLTTTNAIA